MNEASEIATDSLPEPESPTLRHYLSRLMRVLSYVAATVVIVMALMVGVARLLLPIVPEYRADIRRWAEGATGFTIEFERIGASWPITGPELSLFNVTISDPEDQQTLLTAGEFRVGVSLLRILREQQVAPNRIVVESTSLELERGESGELLVQGRLLADLLQLDAAQDRPLPELDIELSDVDVIYLDSGRTGNEIDLLVEQLDIELDAQVIRTEGELVLNEEYGDRMTVVMDLPVVLFTADQQAEAESGLWNIYIAGERLDLAKLAALAIGGESPLRGGRGDLTLWADLVGQDPVNVAMEADLENVALVSPAAIESAFPTIAGRVEWEKRLAGWLLSGSDLVIDHDGDVSDGIEFNLELQQDSEQAPGTIVANANQIPLDAVFPIARAFAPEDMREKFLPDDLRGDVLDLDLVYLPADEGLPEYAATLRVSDLGFARKLTGESAYGITATIDADQAGGRIEIASGASEFSLPAVFAENIDIDSIEGFLVWRVTDELVRVLSDNIDLQTPHAQASARFELEVPRDGSSPIIDLTGVARAADASQTVRYLPLQRLPPQIVKWMKRAILGGRITNADISMRGPLAEFPFRPDEEGKFRIDVDVEGATLDYADNWPRVENLDGEVRFEGVSITSSRNSGSIGGLRFSDRRVKIADLATAVLDVSGQQRVAFDDALGFLRATPVAEALGPVLGQVYGDGNLDADFSLSLPLAKANEFELNVELQALGNAVGLDGLNFGFTEVKGPVRIRNDKISAEDLSATLLGEEVRLDIRPSDPDETMYSHVATVAGVTPARKWMETLNLPFSDRISGSLPWRAIALIPARQKSPDADLHILVDSNLAGLESTFPRPMAKLATEPKQLTMDIGFTADEHLDITGELLDELSWALRLKRAGEQWQIERTAVQMGDEEVMMPPNPGVELFGRIDYLNLNEWLELGEGDASPAWQELYKEATLEVDELSVFGITFRDVEVEAATGENDWRVSVDGPSASGRLTVPLDSDSARPVDLEMQRLHLIETDSEADEAADPRDFRPAIVDVGDFRLGDMSFGSLQTNISRVPDGVLVNPIQTRSPSFSMEGEGAWLAQRADDSLRRSRLRLALNSSDIKSMLTDLGYDAVIEGEKAIASVDVTWPGGPSRDFIDRSTGSFEIKMERGLLEQLEPGGGRLLGVLSVAALPRRLALDFSDLLDEGLSFDVLQGRFTLDNGHAYTCNLSVESSVTDIGIVGRAGLTAEDYQQFAVVRPHVSNVLPLGGAVVGGPGVGAAMWVFSQIFKKPLSALGESYYRVSGSWDDPAVQKLAGNELDNAAFSNCEQYLAALQAELKDTQ